MDNINPNDIEKIIEDFTAENTAASNADAQADICPLAPYDLAAEIARILDSKKARDIKLLHVEKQTVLADYFVICTGNSNTQLKALSGEIEEKLEEKGIYASHIEGYNEASWILMDYSSVIVHIFNRDNRKFYNLEKLWSEAVEVELKFDDENGEM